MSDSGFAVRREASGVVLELPPAAPLALGPTHCLLIATEGGFEWTSGAEVFKARGTRVAHRPPGGAFEELTIVPLDSPPEQAVEDVLREAAKMSGCGLVREFHGLGVLVPGADPVTLGETWRAERTPAALARLLKAVAAEGGDARARLAPGEIDLSRIGAQKIAECGEMRAWRLAADHGGGVIVEMGGGGWFTPRPTDRLRVEPVGEFASWAEEDPATGDARIVIGSGKGRVGFHLESGGANHQVAVFPPMFPRARIDEAARAIAEAAGCACEIR